MPLSVKEILEKESYSGENLVILLDANEADTELIFQHAAEIKRQFVGNKVFFRGLIEFSNICSKNCYYCGIRRGNKKPERYVVAESEVLDAASYALENGFGSMVLQSGERTDKKFISTVETLLRKIKSFSNGRLGITLSMGEQTEETFRRWYEAGAHRYLLRIETSNRELYYKIHPNDARHDYDRRLEALDLLRKTGYNVGSGVMIGLPFQTTSDLAGDLMFFREHDIDMAGMGPYIEHVDTPLYKYKDILLPQQKRFDLSMKMVALLRIIMKDVNIAATTAMQTLDKDGRVKALKAGANIIMPNLTPLKYREDYLLYENKPGTAEQVADSILNLEKQIHAAGCVVGYGEWGDSKHFSRRTSTAG
ncbi:MAG TPA: [FeFe] hydrogenase H-cluster radical SAM maturase HydE [Bacteroidales bacterium]|nr:[FeFe] hydrogenase H-cluster radical SAM maturase HydE [Bacteroidales bacterium]HPT01150.1 [FeFe] hydrogenase H-cluster radical SAM maturase HydE [Bacteroidales bacterium]